MSRTSLTLALAVLSATAACRDSITVRGRINETAQQSSPLLAASGVVPISGGPVTRVLAFRDFGHADSDPVAADGTFSLSLSRQSPVGLVFLDAANAVVGHLALAEGIEVLPLTLAAEDVAVVDLANIEFADGGLAVPSANPIDSGGALALSQTERLAFALQSDLFSSLLRNLDLDGDTTIDVLSSRTYWLMFAASHEAGIAGTAPPSAPTAEPQPGQLRLYMSDGQAVAQNPSARLLAPGGLEFFSTQPENRWAGDQSDSRELPCYVFRTEREASNFGVGAYVIEYGSGVRRRLDFDVRFSPATHAHLVARDLWWELVDGTRLRVHWRWGLVGAGAPSDDTVDVSRLIRLVIPNLRFSDGSSSHVDNPPPGDTSFTFDLAGHSVAEVSDVIISARDLFGNEYETRYRLR